jgi:hypothetical protein
MRGAFVLVGLGSMLVGLGLGYAIGASGDAPAQECPGAFRAPADLRVSFGDFTISCDDRGCRTREWHGDFKTVSP